MIMVPPLALQLPSFDSISQSQNLGAFIGSLYNLAIALIGLIIFFNFVYAGYLYLTSFGNASKAETANKRMTNAVVGVLLLISAYLIINVINPDLLKNGFSIPSIPPPAPQFTYIGVDPNEKKIGCGTSGDVQLSYLQDGSLSNGGHVSFTITGDIGSQTTWSAPGGNPDHGSGTTVSTTYSGAGHNPNSGFGYSISVSSLQADGKTATAVCGVHVSPYKNTEQDPNADNAVSKFNNAGVSVKDGVVFNGIDPKSISNMLGIKGGCDSSNDANHICSMQITKFSHINNQDGFFITVTPQSAWIKYLGGCCSITENGQSGTDPATGVSYSKISATQWAISIPN